MLSLCYLQRELYREKTAEKQGRGEDSGRKQEEEEEEQKQEEEEEEEQEQEEEEGVNYREIEKSRPSH
jgi:hypothetical protein